MKESIKKRVLGDVTHWLLNIRMKASEIGDFAMAQTEAEIRLKEELSKRRQQVPHVCFYFATDFGLMRIVA